MAIKFDPDYNREIRRIVYNFNRKRNRAIKRGIADKYLPEKRYVSELKMEFDTRSALNRELRNLEKFNTMGLDAYSVVETLGGGRTSQYNLDYIKSNLKATKDFYDRQIEDFKELRKTENRNHELDSYLDQLVINRQKLELDIDYLDDAGIRTFMTLTKKAGKYNKAKITGYRGFLTVVDQVMQYLGYDDKVINSLFEKLSDLSPNEFMTMYRHSNLIDRIYDLINSPPIAGRFINTDDDNAKELIDLLITDFDKIKEESIS